MRSGWFNLIHDSPMDYHSGKDTLIVGDLDVGVVLLNGEEKYISELPCARMEAEMIGKLLELEPSRILRGDSTYPIAPIRYANKSPEKNDFILNMGDVSKVQLRAKLVVLSCCHNGRGKSKAERIFRNHSSLFGIWRTICVGLSVGRGRQSYITVNEAIL